MSTSHTIRPVSPHTGSGQPQTPGLSVLGWLILCFAIMPVSMAIKGEGPLYMWIGLAMVAAGLGMLLVERRVRRSR